VKVVIIAGAISAFIAVALGAFAAHALRDKLAPDLFNVWEVGVRYQMYHALALIALGWLIDRYPGSALPAAGWLFVAGSVLFSGSLYVLALSGIRWLGAITPFGGLCFLAGWLWVGWCLWRSA
jgi:uncharacterized membrane protein YgdD (TMEM256/DUF423 family)